MATKQATKKTTKADAILTTARLAAKPLYSPEIYQACMAHLTPRAKELLARGAYSPWENRDGTPRKLTPLSFDPPELFDRMPLTKQAALRLWIRLALRPTVRIRAKRSDSFAGSYGLKHLAEDTLGWYVENAEMKGAMLAEGYRYRPEEDSGAVPGLNWDFNSTMRCPHTQQYLSAYAGHSPAHSLLCQATPIELMEFDAVRRLGAELWR